MSNLRMALWAVIFIELIVFVCMNEEPSKKSVDVGFCMPECGVCIMHEHDDDCVVGWVFRYDAFYFAGKNVGGCVKKQHPDGSFCMDELRPGEGANITFGVPLPVMVPRMNGSRRL